MKKLLFATALVASAAAFADGEPTAINAISFEGYTAGVAIPADGTSELDEGSQDKQAAYFLYKDGDADGSTVKAFDAEGNAATPGITRPFYFASAQPNANYLELSTEGGILWRSIGAVTNTGTSYDLGNAQAIGSAGLYLDTLVQFTPTEDGGDPGLTQDDKLAIWLNVDSNQQTNLQVRANLYDFGEAPSATATTFTLAPETGTKEIVAGQWYRLTVKATPNVMNTDENGIIPVFEIFIDGVQMCATTAQFTSGMVTQLSGMSALSEDAATAIAANKLFPSLQQMGNQGDTPTLQGVGFKGSGALDDIVWTTEDPFQASPQPEGYVVDLNGNDVPITLTDAQLAVLAEAGVNTNSVTAVNEALDTQIGTTGVKAWEAAVLGLAPTAAGLQEFKIDSVTIGADGKVTIELANGVTLATGQGIDITLKVIGSNDLSTWDTTNPLATVTNSLEIPDITPASGETKKFYKVVVEFAKTSAQN